jgi:hypothetical protein
MIILPLLTKETRDYKDTTYPHIRELSCLLDNLHIKTMIMMMLMMIIIIMMIVIMIVMDDDDDSDV